MKKIEILNKKLAKIEAKVKMVSIEKKDTSIRRSGGYYSTINANLSGLIVIEKISRTKYLNSYICVESQELASEYFTAKNEVKKEYLRLALISQKKWEKESVLNCKKFAEKQIKDGTILTNYVKKLIEGNTNIYWANPSYGHSDYNKSAAMKNTPKNRKLATQLNQLIDSSINNLKAKYLQD